MPSDKVISTFSSRGFVFANERRFENKYFDTMGITYCKSLFTKDKTQYAVNANGNHNHARPAAAASSHHVSTIQNAVATQGRDSYVTLMSAYLPIAQVRDNEVTQRGW